jgi:hypothetical protein
LRYGRENGAYPRRDDELEHRERCTGYAHQS